MIIGFSETIDMMLILSICGRGGHLGHVTQISKVNIYPLPSH